jgi:hypothetical protein
MNEIVSPGQAEAIVRAVAAALGGGGVALAVVGALFGGRRRRALTLGGLLAAAGGLVYILWMVYNLLTARLGLDSVRALLINLGIFVAVGLLYGVLAARAWRWAGGGQGAERSRCG